MTIAENPKTGIKNKYDRIRGKKVGKINGT
jgi:hypothetical protein